MRDERGVNWVVRRCAIDYLKPARLDEMIEVVTELRRTARRLAGHDPASRAADEEILVRAELVVACMGATGRPVRLPPHVRTALAQVQCGGLAPLTPHSGITL